MGSPDDELGDNDVVASRVHALDLEFQIRKRPSVHLGNGDARLRTFLPLTVATRIGVLWVKELPHRVEIAAGDGLHVLSHDACWITHCRLLLPMIVHCRARGSKAAA